MAGGALGAAEKIIKNKTVNKSIGTTVKNLGDQVLAGVTGNRRGLAQRCGERVLKSNMTKEQVKKMSKEGMEKAALGITKQAIEMGAGKGAIKAYKKDVGKAMKGIAKKGLDPSAQKALQNTVKSSILDNHLAKNSLGYKIGDAIGGGVRDTVRSLKGGNSISTALGAGFTKNGQVNMSRVAGAAFGAGVAGRAISGGGLYRDKYGRVNLPGVPFI